MSTPNQRLRGLSTMLSASVPAKYRSGVYQTDRDEELARRRAEMYGRSVDAAVVIKDAVVSLARAVFAHGGRLVFGGHPAISPLVATVAGEYFDARLAREHERDGESPIAIYQSEVFAGYEPPGTRSLAAARYAKLHWTRRQEGEHLQPNKAPDPLDFPASLTLMRQVMIDEGKPAALVCAGGMEGVEAEVRLFIEWRRWRYEGDEAEARKRRPVYVLATTGGAALRMARGQSEDIDVDALCVIDDDIAKRLKTEMWEVSRRPDLAGIDIGPPEAVTYPLVMQKIVEEIAANRDVS